MAGRPDEPVHQHLLWPPTTVGSAISKFPYPLADIRGTLEMFDGNWTFRNLEGSNDKARVTCEGRLTPGLGGNELVLNLWGRTCPWTRTFATPCSPHIQQVWHNLRPRGVVDLTAEVRYLSAQKKFSVGVRAQPQPTTRRSSRCRFPYRLDQLQGVLLYRDGQSTFEHCKAEHGAVKVSTEGYCDFAPDGRWHIHLAELSVDRLRADRELIQALPERLRKAVVELNPTGPINLRGTSTWSGSAAGRAAAVALGRAAGPAAGGPPVRRLSPGEPDGEVSLRGGFDGQRLRSRGELAIDSLNYKDCQ